MKYLVLIGMQAMIFCGWIAAEDAGTDTQANPAATFQQQVIAVVGEQLLQPEMSGTHALIRDLSARTGMAEQKVRKGLLTLFDSLEAERKGKTELWQRIKESGDVHVEPKRVDKLVKETAKKARKIFKKNEKKPLGEILRHGTRKANLQDYRARAVLLQALGIDTDGAAIFLGFPPRVTLLLEETSDWQRAGAESGVQLGRSSNSVSTDSPIAQSAVQQGILYYLAQELQNSPRIKWVSSQPKRYMKPKGKLIFGIVQFNATMRTYGEGENQISRPAIYLEAQVTIDDIATGLEVHRDNIVVQYEFAMERDAATQGQGNLGKFYQKAALAVSENIEVFLAQ